MAIARQTRHGNQAENSAPQALMVCPGAMVMLSRVGAFRPSHGAKLRKNMRIPVAMITKSVRLTSRLTLDWVDEVDMHLPSARLDVHCANYVERG